MATVPDHLTTAPLSGPIDYPTSDGRPMGETDLHRNIMFAAIETLKLHYAGQRVYVSGNILLFYQPGNRRRHVSPDVLVVKDLEQRDRKNYLLWLEGRPPNLVIEVTSESTREEDLEDKFEIYRDKVQVAEYFLFDPWGEYLHPTLQGYRLSRGEYARIEPLAGRLPSEELGLHLEEHESQLRFYDPATARWLPTVQEAHQQAEAERQRTTAAWQHAESERARAEAERQRTTAAWQHAESERARAEAKWQRTTAAWQHAESERARAEAERQRAESEREQAQAEADRLRQELEILRRQLQG
jgi:Uma2 family endonuclease